MSFLCAATTLEQCILGRIVLLPADEDIITPVSNTSLRELYLHWTNDRPAGDGFLGSITLPALQKLSVNTNEINFTLLADFIRRSSCSLTFFDVVWERSTGNPVELYSLFHSVTDLSIGARDLMKAWKEDPQLFPKLRHCLISGDDEYNVVATGPNILSVTDKAGVSFGALDASLFKTAILWAPASEDEKFRILDGWPSNTQDYELIPQRVAQLNHLDENFSAEDGEPVVSQVNKILSDIEGLGDIQAQFVHASSLLDTLRRLLVLLSSDHQTARFRVQALLDKYTPTVDSYLNAVGWMKADDVLVYAQRRGTTTLKRLDRKVGVFESFCVENGNVVV
ncbi:hypothetical protein NLJ89_g6007 [Agrocybe chaxingu]|uniref:Uncharacterized protein n=1 Tax=Agrocybe chaxingu TaxID=84603 RepID=A0A9W8MWV1_9AGAR|nr:hypothetical protein NLJ89_g6007 [Agrocybe chaxingu]